MRRVIAILVSIIASGVMLHGALPPNGWWPLAWIAFVPLFLAVNGSRFLVGFLAGLGAVGVTAWLGIAGVGYEMMLPSDGSPAWIVVGCALFGFALAIVTGIAAESCLARPWRLAAIAVLLEACLLIYLPASVALTQSRVPAMLAVASVGGIWAISYALWWFNLAVAKQFAQGRLAPGIVATVVLWIALPNLGQFWKRAEGRKGAILLVQTPETELDRLREFNGNLPDTLAIWPEFGGMGAAPGGDTSKLKEYSANSTAFVTSFQTGERPLPHNVAALFLHGAEVGRYEKRKLFGGETSMHVPGRDPAAAQWGNTKVGLNICFDSCFPGVMRETVALGANIIALPTIDPPSPHHWIAAMHSAFTPIRAAELGVPIARADGMAYSMAVDGKGYVRLEFAPGEASAVVDLPMESYPTPYRKLGDWVLFACGLTLFGSGVWSVRRRKAAVGMREEPS